MTPSLPSGPEHLAAQKPQTKSSTRRHAANLCAACLAACFFLPWIRIIFFSLSGFDYQKLSDEGKIFWLMPILCLITLAVGLAGKSQKIVGQLAGLTPFGILIYGLSQLGSDLIKALEPGAWIALVLGAMLFILARR